jgi:hypothetical protein
MAFIHEYLIGAVGYLVLNYDLKAEDSGDLPNGIPRTSRSFSSVYGKFRAYYKNPINYPKMLINGSPPQSIRPRRWNSST